MEKPLREWTRKDVLALIQLGRVEGPTLEYKAALYETSERGNREFLLDICSMANSEGGTLILGMAEQRGHNGPTGVPDPIAPVGLECDNPEQTLTAYEARLLEGIDGRILVETRAMLVGDGRQVLLFRVPNSLDKPHRVRHQGRTWFPARRERQRYELNTAEIKEMVMRTASRLEYAEQSVSEALSRDVEDHEYPSFVVAVIPVFTKNFVFDFWNQDVVHTFARLDLLGRGQRITFSRVSR
jgi:predicted HTH transcriptional regulator